MSVSIGIPCYNRPALLERAVEAVRNQTYFDLEIIISDNASTDPAVERFGRAVAERDPRITYIRQPTNVGPQKNFAFVLEAATKPFFMWAADDDWIEPNFVELCLAEFERSPELVLVTPEAQFDTPDGPYPFFAEGDKLRALQYHSPGQYAADFVDCLFGNLVYGVHRREALFHLGRPLLDWCDAPLNEFGLLTILASKGPIRSLETVGWHKRADWKRCRNYEWERRGGWRRLGPTLISPGRSLKWIRYYQRFGDQFEVTIDAMALDDVDKHRVRRAMRAYCSRGLRAMLLGWKPRIRRGGQVDDGVRVG